MWPLIPLKSSCDYGYDRYSDNAAQSAAPGIPHEHE